MQLTIVISYYKALDNLKLILLALNSQSNINFEVIISEDDNNIETVNFIEKNKELYKFSIKHLFQENDNGFRKNMMLNKSIKKANGKTIVFIDGDCIPHKHFAKAYIENTKENTMLKGRRVMLGERITEEITQSKSIDKLRGFSVILSDSSKKKDAVYTGSISLMLTMKDKGLLGCNWGIQKKYLENINGFDEDYVRAAVGEDTDVEWRLKRSGVISKSMKNKAIVYHLHHERSYSKEGVNLNIELLNSKIKADNFVCLNGLEKI